MNVMMLLEMASGSFGDRVAIRSADAELSYAELFAAAGRAAAAVRESGAQHLSLLDESSLAVPVGLFGSAWAGVPFVPLNYRLTGDELEALLARVAPAYLVTDEVRAAEESSPSVLQLEASSAFLGRCRGEESAPAEGEWSMDPDEIAILLFTSGTTGAPKAAVLRHKHLVSYILGSVEFASAGDDESTLVCVPPYHIAGMASVLSSVYSGRRIVQLPRFDAAKWLELARREAVTHAFLVPTMLARIVDELEGQGDAACPGLRAIAYGGGKMPLSVIERAMALFPETAFTNAYGLTETSSTIAVLGPDEHRAAVAGGEPEAKQRLVSVGRPLPGVEVEIRDPEGTEVSAGGRGEIHVRGEQVSGEYLGRGSQLLADGWFPTRDGGYLDEEGYLFIDGRIDDVIVRGGENLSPGEIEDVLLEHPSVRECAVIGVPDEQWGEAVAAVIVPSTPGEVDCDGLRAFVRERLRSSRVPERIVERSELPYNETGKLLRRELRSELSGDS